MSDWKNQSQRRRDFRQRKADLLATGETEFHGVRPWPGRKDCKKWCRGKAGVKHEPRCMPYSASHPWLSEWRALVCVTCGKQLAYYAPTRTIVVAKPQWVTD